MAGEVPSSDVEQAVQELDRVRDEWLRRPDVEGIDVGPSQQGGETVAIRVYLTPGGTSADHGEPLPERLGRFPVECIPASFGPEPAPGDETGPA